MAVDHTSSREQIAECLHAALLELVERDSWLISEAANERSITHHLARYMETQFEGWHIDVEYNRNLGDIKRLLVDAPSQSADDVDAVSVFPDIIVHERGTTNNLLVVEVKKLGGRGHDWDIQKLKAFTSSLDGYPHYCWGAHVVICASAADLPNPTWFKNGKEVSVRESD